MGLLLYSFSQIKMWAESEDLHVTKLVEFITQIPEQLDLYFFDCFALFYTFLKFIGVHVSFTVSPLESSFYITNRSMDMCTLTESEPFRRGPSPAARERWGKRFRAQWRTLGWSGLGRRGSEEAPPRRSRDDGEVEYKTRVIFEMKKC